MSERRHEAERSATDPELAAAEGSQGGSREAPTPRGTLRLLTDRTVGSYFFAKVLASMGIWVHNIVAAVVVYEITGSALLVGTISVAQFTPQVFLAPWMGAIADRGNRRMQTVLGRGLAGLGSGSLAVWLAMVGVDGLQSAWPIIGSALVVGLGFAVSAPAMHALVPSMARPEELSSVVAITTSPFTFARAAGPALGAILFVTGGPVLAFAVAGSAQLVYSLVVAWMPLRRVPRPAAKDRSMLGGLRHLRRDVSVGLLLLSVVAAGFGVDPVITLTPAIADAFGEGEELVAMMASAFGLGAAITVLTFGPVRRRVSQPRLGSGGLLVLAGSMLALGVSPTPAAALVTLFIGGMGMMAAVTALTTQIQERVPEELRARLMALWAIAFVGSRPLAASIHGAIADIVSPEAALGFLAVLITVIVLITRPAALQRATERAVAP